MSEFIKVSSRTAKRLQELADKGGITKGKAVRELLDAAELQRSTRSVALRGCRPYMFIPARYETTCPGCRCCIYRGTTIAWKPGHYAWHEECIFLLKFHTERSDETS